MATQAERPAAKPWYRLLYVHVLFAIAIGVLVGWKFPHLATNDWIKALGDGFVRLIRMVIAPIIFCTVVSGISHIQDARKVGRVGVKALVYFEIVSTFALVIGLVIGNFVDVGSGLAGKANAMTAFWAISFFWLRVAHAVVYLLAVPFVRTLIFTLGFVAVAGIFVELMR